MSSFDLDKRGEMLEALMVKFDVDKGFENELPLYLIDFLIANADRLTENMKGKNELEIKTLLADLTDKLPIEMGNFKELFYVVFLGSEGKPRLYCVEGNYDVIDGEKTRAAVLNFGGIIDSGWEKVEEILVIHTHPIDSKIGFSGMEGDVRVLVDGPNSFSAMLSQFPSLEKAWVGLRTAGKRGRVLLASDETWGIRHFFDRDKLLNLGEEYR